MLPFRFVAQKKRFSSKVDVVSGKGKAVSLQILRPSWDLFYCWLWWWRWWQWDINDGGDGGCLSWRKCSQELQNKKKTFGVIWKIRLALSLLQILMKLVEGPQVPRHDNRDTVDGQEWIIVHMSIPRRKTQTGSWWSMRKFSQRRETRPSCAIAWGKFSRKCISFFKAVYFYFCEAAHHISRQTGWKRVYLRGNFLFARLHRPSATSSSQLSKN